MVLYLVLKIWISTFILYRCLLLYLYNDILLTYSEHKGSIVIFLNSSLQESLPLEFVMILIFFFNSEYFNAGC